MRYKKKKKKKKAKARSTRPWTHTREKKKRPKKRAFFLLHRAFISSEKFGVWDLCVHHVLNFCFFFFSLLLSMSICVVCFSYSLLLSHIITLFLPVSPFFFLFSSWYRLSGMDMVGVVFCAFPFPLLPPCEIELSLSARYQDLSFCFNLLVQLFPFSDFWPTVKNTASSILYSTLQLLPHLCSSLRSICSISIFI